MNREETESYTYALLAYISDDLITAQNKGKISEKISMKKDTSEGKNILYACRFAAYLLANPDYNLDEIKSYVFENPKVSDEIVGRCRSYAQRIIDDLSIKSSSNS